MAVVRKSDISARRDFVPPDSLISSRRRRRSSSELPVSSSLPVQDLNQQSKTPLWLLRLHAIHRHSGIVAFLLVAATLAIYGCTVYSQQLWSQAYRKLQNLQRDERQLTTANEILKNKMAQEAQTSAAGLISPSPTGTIFLRPAPENHNSAPSTPNPTSTSQAQQQTFKPLGY